MIFAKGAVLLIQYAHMKKQGQQRRDFFRLMGIGGVSLAFPTAIASGQNRSFKQEGSPLAILMKKVYQTPFIDTHEHLFEEKERTFGGDFVGGKCNDWTMIMNHYLDSDMRSAGMSEKDYSRFFSLDQKEILDPRDKWKLLAPYWPYIKNTGYGQAVSITIRELYGIGDLSLDTVNKLQSGYESLNRPGFYRKVLQEKANIESCQVDRWNYKESDMPTLLMTDINMTGLVGDPGNLSFSESSGLPTESLEDWLRVIDWYFSKYGKYVTAIKIASAYSRSLGFEKLESVGLDKIYKQLVNKDKVELVDRRKLEDFLFWHVVSRADENHLPVKMHTGYHARWGSKEDFMDLYQVRNNPSDVARLCTLSPETRFVFMHIGYPYYEEMLAVAKQFPNAYIDMCWAWILNPLASKDFLKKFILTVPTNKIFTFGGDYNPVEPVLGHAVIARNGIALALSELVDEGYLHLDEALKLTDLIMHENARKVFKLAEKTVILKNLPSI